MGLGVLLLSRLPPVAAISVPLPLPFLASLAALPHLMPSYPSLCRRYDHTRAAPRVFLQALVDIPAGTEVLASYGSDYWQWHSEQQEQEQQAQEALNKVGVVLGPRGEGG